MDGTTNSLTLGVILKNIDDQATNILSENDVKTYKSRDGVAIEYDPNDFDTYSELAEDELPDLALGILNPSDGTFYERPELNSALADDSGESADDLDLGLLPDLVSFMDDHSDLIDKAKDDVLNRYYYVYSRDDEQENGEQSEEKSASPQTPLEAAQSSTKENTDDSENNVEASTEGSDELESVSPEQARQAIRESVSEASSAPAVANNSEDNNSPAITNIKYHPEADPLLKKAYSLFTNVARVEWPQFDPATSNQLRPDYITAETNISVAEDTAVQEIYQLLKQKKSGIDALFEDKIKDDTAKHNKALKDLDENRQIDIDKVKKERKSTYEANRDQWIEDQRQPLMDAYDRDHKDNYIKALSADINEIQDKHDLQKKIENERFNSFKDKAQAKFVDEQLDKVDISKIVDAYNDTVADNVQYLKNQAKKFVTEVAKLTANYQNSINALQKERDDIKSEYDNLKHNLEEQKRLGIDKGVKDATSDLANQLEVKRKEIEAKDNELRAIKKAQQASEANLSQVSAQLNEATSKLLNKSNQLDTANAQLEQIQKATQIPTTLANQNNLVANTQQSSPEQTANDKSSDNERKKTSVGVIVLDALLGVLAVGGLTFGILGYHNMNSSQNTVRTSAVVTKTDKNRSQPKISDSVKQYKQGDTWTYHNSTDNKDYTVTMDNPTHGHYTDQNGQQHIITLNND